MAIVERNICVITALNSEGIGISNTESLEASELIEIPYTVPGEIVEFEKHTYRNKSSFILSKIQQKSEHRITPQCEYFTICGGCSLQHLEEEYYIKFKLDNLQQTLEKHAIRTPPIAPLKSIGSGQRRRVVFEAIKKQDQIFLGFKKFHSNQIVNIDSCLVILPELSNLIIKLKTILKKLLIDKEKCKILITNADNGIDLIIETNNNGHIDSETATILQDFAASNKVIRLTIINNGKWNLLYFAQKPHIIFENIAVNIDNHSFLQVSKASDIILTELLNSILAKIKPTDKQLQIADLFCGRGTLTIPAAKFGTVDAFEIDKASVKALTEAITDIKKAPIKTPVNYLELLKIYQRDLFNDPLAWDELNKYDIMIINPPRAGAKEQAKLLSTSTIKTIIYLSCNPESFARDAKIILHHNKYQLQEITPIDQFHWSHHIELLGIFIAKEV